MSISLRLVLVQDGYYWIIDPSLPYPDHRSRISVLKDY